MLDKAFEALKKYDWGQDRSVLAPIDDAVVETYGDAAARKELEGRLVAALESDLPYDSQQFLCRKLRAIGTAACVPTLSALLADEKLSHMARYALESIPAAEAGKALRDALPNLKGELRIGVVGSLGVRQDEEAIGAIGKLVADSDTATARSAANALGAIGTPAAAKALGQGMAKEGAASAAADASMVCAENLLAAGKNTDALGIYKVFAAGDQPKHIKLAATRGMLACAKKKD